MFNVDEFSSYMKNMIPSRPPEILEMEKYAKENNVPIMEEVGIEALLIWLKLYNPNRILEIGTAIGYSAIRMATALKDVQITSIERDEKMYHEAIKNISQNQLSDRIEVIFGDALETFEEIKNKGNFDCFFIDAAKGQYQRFFELYEPLLNDQGVIFTDNVLFRGLVLKNEINNKRLGNLARKINTYNQWLMNHPNYETMIIPVGDGIAISKKR